MWICATKKLTRCEGGGLRDMARHLVLSPKSVIFTMAPVIFTKGPVSEARSAMGPDSRRAVRLPLISNP